MRRIKISASMMCANLGNLQQVVNELEEAGIDLLHFDVMDGNYVPNFALGPLEMRALRKFTTLPFDVHLMVDHPEKHLDLFAAAGADWLSIHIETTRAPLRVLRGIRDRGMKAGIVLNPATPVTFLDWLMPYVDLVVLMTVEPGYAGQAWIPEMAKKVSEVHKMVSNTGLPIEIEVDGNINPKTIPCLVEAGATMLVGGSSGLFLSDKPLRLSLAGMHQAIAEGINSVLPPKSDP